MKILYSVSYIRSQTYNLIYMNTLPPDDKPETNKIDNKQPPHGEEHKQVDAEKEKSEDKKSEKK